VAGVSARAQGKLKKFCSRDKGTKPEAGIVLRSYSEAIGKKQRSRREKIPLLSSLAAVGTINAMGRKEAEPPLQPQLEKNHN